MKVTIANLQKNGRNMGGQKELVKAMSAVANTDGQLRELVTAQFYKSRRADGASPVYCSIWIHAHGIYGSGSGRACGYGYHKDSAALQRAIDSAGIALDSPIDGRGETAMAEALTAIARAVGAVDDVLIVSHGQ